MQRFLIALGILSTLTLTLGALHIMRAHPRPGATAAVEAQPTVTPAAAVEEQEPITRTQTVPPDVDVLMVPAESLNTDVQYEPDGREVAVAVETGEMGGTRAMGREEAVAAGKMGGLGVFRAFAGARRETLAPGRDRQSAARAPDGDERYAALVERGFVRCDAPGGDASTFAIDVDSASYSNVRRHLRAGGRPPPEAVRSEELINAFDYHYPPPAADDPQPFRAATAVAACPWAEGHRLVRVALKGRALDHLTRPPLNVVFLIDTSGSMRHPAKLPLVQHGLGLLARQLDGRDRLAIVTYAGEAGVALAAVSGLEQERIAAVIAGLQAGGSTNGSGGIAGAYAEALKGAGPGVQSRVVLCTDGDFNVGTTGVDELKRMIAERRASGIRLNAYGFGTGNLKDDTLEALADTGNGVYGYIDDEHEAGRLMADEALGQLVTIAKDVKIQVFFNPAAVAGWRLIGYENRLLAREDFNDDRVDAGEIGSGHAVTALYEVVPAGGRVPGAGADPNPFVAAPTQPAVLAPTTLLRLRLRWQPPGGGESALIEHDVAGEPMAMDEDFRLAAAVAEFAMLLRDAPQRGTSSWDEVLTLAADGASPAQGQRAEFIDLVARARAVAVR